MDRLADGTAPELAFAHRVAETILLGGALYKLNLEMTELRQEGPAVYFGARALIENVCSVCCCSAFFAKVVADAAGRPLPSLHSVVALFAWAYMLWFLLGFRQTGPHVVMIWRMLHDDVLPFGAVMAIFMCGFAQAFYVTFEERPDPARFVFHLKLCFASLMGSVNLDDWAAPVSPGATVAIAAVFVITCVLLLNLLIAMMGNTYARINGEADLQWHLQRARSAWLFLFLLEHSCHIRI
jgi:hypothetical protein